VLTSPFAARCSALVRCFDLNASLIASRDTYVEMLGLEVKVGLAWGSGSSIGLSIGLMVDVQC